MTTSYQPRHVKKRYQERRKSHFLPLQLVQSIVFPDGTAIAVKTKHLIELMLQQVSALPIPTRNGLVMLRIIDRFFVFTHKNEQSIIILKTAEALNLYQELLDIDDEINEFSYREACELRINTDNEE